MFVPLPNLDDRRWADLVDEGRALIPVYSPTWTDHNAHDPGITLMEMLAWITETDIYRVDRIPDSHLRAFLSLIGMQVLPPSAARAVVVFTLKKQELAADESEDELQDAFLSYEMSVGEHLAVDLPANTMLTTGQGSPAVKFRLRRDISVLPSTLVSVQVESSGKFRDVTSDWQRGKPVSPFGNNPQTNDSLYLGFDPALHRGATLSLYFKLSGDKTGDAERQRILDEITSRSQSSCQTLADCGQKPTPTTPTTTLDLPPHHSAGIVWEVQTRLGVWQTIEANDNTRSLTLSGSVELPLPQAAALTRLGDSAKPLAYVRARFASGSFDAAPVAARVFANAVEVEQCALVSEEWTVAKGVVAVGTPPLPGGFAWLYFEFDASGEISCLEFTSESNDALFVRMLTYQSATNAQTGRLVVEAQRVGLGTGAPNQTYGLRGPQLCEDGFELYTLEMGYLRKWRQRESLLASKAADLDFVLEAGEASVRFGDGQNGRVPPMGAAIIAIALGTAGARGNVAGDTISALDTGPNNVALPDDFERITNPDPASGGADEETLAHAVGRAIQTLQKQSRAVTLGDCEALALETPGTRIARAAALANQHPGFQCYAAPGFITLVIIPELPSGRPVPSTGLLSAVSAYLNRRHVIGTRIEVIGPEYLEVGVKTEVRAFPGQSKIAVRDATTAALQKFLDPLQGGPEGKGWPLGRDVYISEVVEVIAAVPGVDHVLSIELEVPGCGAQCGNVCLSPLALAVSGTHQVKVI
jgi:hypothetical protein